MRSVINDKKMQFNAIKNTKTFSNLHHKTNDRTLLLKCNNASM